MGTFSIEFLPDPAFGSAGSWRRRCLECDAEALISALGTTPAEAARGRCFVCDPVPARPLVMGPDPEARFTGGADDDLRAIDDNYDRECTLAELAFTKAYRKGDRA